MSIESMVKNVPVRYGDEGNIVRMIQTGLRSAGHELVPDGRFGDITRTAVKRFQGTYSLNVDGVVGGKTGAALDRVLAEHLGGPPPALPSTLAVAPWLSQMRAISGIKEVPGPQDNPLIIEWRHVIGKKFPHMAKYANTFVHDSIAWCGHGQAYCLAMCDIPPPFVAGEATRCYMWAGSFGHETAVLAKQSRPVLGSILVFVRDGGGHVGTYESEDDTHYHVRGCNQGDMVNVSRVSKQQFRHAMWPRAFACTSNPVFRSASEYRLSDSLA
jgi:uncharacterized protein (TIGR02594 family)